MLRQKARAITAGLVGTAATAALVMSLTMGAATSSAAKAPADFFGVASQTPLTTPDLQRMGQANVGSLRIIVNWEVIDPTSAAGDNNWSTVDPIVLDAANNGVDILPFIFGTPAWVAKDLDHQKCSGSGCVIWAPKTSAGLEAWKTFVGEFVDRYGQNGTFWAEHPEVTKNPIDEVQIWNEQNSRTFFRPKPSPKAYAKLLSSAAEAIRSRDANTEIILGGMAELSGSHKAIVGSKFLTDLYRVKGAKEDFDAVATHPYGASVGKVASQVEKYRKVMKKARDSGSDMYVTEVGAGSASGGSSLNRGKKGQANLLTDIYKYFMKKRNSLNVQEVDWFSWQDAKVSICDWCKTSGLLTKSGKAKPSYKAFTKLTGGN